MQFEVEAMVRVGKQPWRTPTMRFPQEPACEAKWNPPRLLEFSTFNPPEWSDSCFKLLMKALRW